MTRWLSIWSQTPSDASTTNLSVSLLSWKLHLGVRDDAHPLQPQIAQRAGHRQPAFLLLAYPDAVRAHVGAVHARAARLHLAAHLLDPGHLLAIIRFVVAAELNSPQLRATGMSPPVATEV